MTAARIAEIFHSCFGGVRLIGGATEPLYVPADRQKCEPGKLYYRDDFATSALHEIAHWCIAGAARHCRIDFGYQYIAPPRDAQEQQQFFDLELNTQALEAIFAKAASITFQVSADNLGFDITDFEARVVAHRPTMQAWLNQRVGHRARVFKHALAKHALAKNALEKNTSENAAWIT